MPAGTLYIVATPIGNLSDISYRAVEVLRGADYIACEDTRHSRKLLDHYGINRPLLSYHEHNEAGRTADLLERVQNGSNIALISDAGTPLISDPGYRLVQQAAAAGLTVVPVPGASALLTALSASGLATDSFFFGGFLPPKENARRKVLEAAASLDCTLIFYEAPHRVVEMLADVEMILGDREVVVARELTKLHEEFVRGRVHEVQAQFAGREAVKGEFTVMVAKGPLTKESSLTVVEDVAARVDAGVSAMEAIKAVAKERGLPKRQVYDEYERSRGR